MRLMGRLQNWYHAHKEQGGGGCYEWSALPCGGQALMETQQEDAVGGVAP